MQPTNSGVTAVQVWTLVIAGLASTGLVTAAIITAIATRNRERNAALRVEQIRVYEAFHRAAWSMYSAVTTGVVNRALQHPRFEGLHAARKAVRKRTTVAWERVHDVQRVGDPLSVLASIALMTAWEGRWVLTVPIPGVTPLIALHQRETNLEILTELLGTVSDANQAELNRGRGASKARRQLSKKLRQLISESLVVEPRSADPGQALRMWGVRSWNDVPTVQDADWQWPNHDWLAIEYRLESGALMRPMDAVLAKDNDSGWRLAIMPHIPAEVLPHLLGDVLLLVVRGGVGGGDDDASNEGWVEGDDWPFRLYIWPNRRADGSVPSGTPL